MKKLMLALIPDSGGDFTLCCPEFRVSIRLRRWVAAACHAPAAVIRSMLTTVFVNTVRSRCASLKTRQN